MPECPETVCFLAAVGGCPGRGDLASVHTNPVFLALHLQLQVVPLAGWVDRDVGKGCGELVDRSGAFLGCARIATTALGYVAHESRRTLDPSAANLRVDRPTQLARERLGHTAPVLVIQHMCECPK